MKEVFDQMEAQVDQHAVDKKCDETERKNLLVENENLISECLSIDVFYNATDYVLIVSNFSNMHDAYTVAQKRIAELKAENFNLIHKIQNDDHDEMIKHFSKLEVEHLNFQLKYKHLKERFGNKKLVTYSYAPAFQSVFVIRNLKEQLQGRGNTIRELKEKISCLQKKHSEADPILDFKALDSQNKDLNAKVSALQDLNERFRAENKKVKQHYKKLYDSIKLTRAKTIEKTTSLNKKKVQLDDLKHLKESVEPLCEIVEVAKAEKPLYSSLSSACLYTKHSQELLVYVIGTYPKDFNKKDRKIATAPLNRNKRVTFVEPGETSTSNSQKHVEQQKMKNTNEPMIPSTGVKDAIAASGSKPRINTKKDRTLPAKSDKKKVEDHSRNNKSSVKQKNCVDSSISYNRDHSRLKNFIKKFIRTVRFENNHFGAIIGYGDYVIGDSVISWDVNGVDLIKGNRGTNLYTIFVEDMMNTINDLARKDLVRGLPRLKFKKDHLCSACQLGKSQKYSYKPKYENTNLEVLTLHMDLYGPMRVQTINGKKYILVIVDDYSSEDLRKLRPTADIEIFVGYAPNRKGYRVYNKRTRQIMEIIHMQFNELTEPMDHVHISIERPVPPVFAVQVLVVSAAQPPISHQGVIAGPTIKDIPFAQADNDPFVNVFAPEPSFDESSSEDVVKGKQEKDKIGTKPDKNRKRGRARQYQRPLTVEKSEKRRNTDSRDQYWQTLKDANLLLVFAGEVVGVMMVGVGDGDRCEDWQKNLGKVYGRGRRGRRESQLNSALAQ
nr:integrase, catalytic region, zinc finger, CCHC-type, peptidase aspartic, catalytic [Tanacetum cinerariifolium]